MCGCQSGKGERLISWGLQHEEHEGLDENTRITLPRLETRQSNRADDLYWLGLAPCAVVFARSAGHKYPASAALAAPPQTANIRRDQIGDDIITGADFPSTNGYGVDVIDGGDGDDLVEDW